MRKVSAPRGRLLVFWAAVVLALVSAAAFENFNTTVFLPGSRATLPINLYLQVRDGSTPVINAISFLLIVTTSTLAVVNLYVGRSRVKKGS